MHRFILPACALFLLLCSSRLEAQADRRGDTIFVADKFLGDSVRETSCIGGYLAFTPRGRYSSVEHELEAEALVLETDAFFSVSFEKSTEIYYWRNGQFHRYATGD